MLLVATFVRKGSLLLKSHYFYFGRRYFHTIHSG